MNNHAIYGFSLGATGRTLYRLKQINCCYLIFPNNLEMYLEMLLHDQPAYILGLGSYSGIDQDKIRIETTCTNQFRNQYIDGQKLIHTGIKPFLKPNSFMKYATAIGNSYCNLISYRIMQLITRRELHAHYTFLHIPKTMKPWIVSQEIDKAIAEYIQKCNK